ncbi:MAG: PAS domain-containing protein, partial [Chitinispirillales bacterium]|nr:PAS domain-containing protein [Chitinispirillales bacterium]
MQVNENIRLMLDATPLACIMWKNFKILECNEEAVRLYRVKDKSAFQEKFFELSPEYQPDGRRSIDLVSQCIQKAYDEGKYIFEWMHQTLDGTLFPAEVTLMRANVKSDDHIVFSYTRDLREQKRMTEELRQANERISLMLNSTPLAGTLRDRNFRVFDCNEEAVRLFGAKDKQEFIERFSELSPEYQPDGQRSVELAAQYVQKAYKEGKYVFEWVHRTLDGTLFPAEITIIRVGEESSGYTTMGYTRDLREEKRMTQNVRETAALLQKVVANYPGAIWSIDRNEVYTLFNGRSIGKFGVTPEQVVGKSFNNAPPQIVYPEIIDYIRKTYTDGAQEWVAKIEQGAFHIRTSPIYGDDGNIIGVVGNSDEITEVIRLQDDLKESLDKANEANTL